MYMRPLIFLAFAAVSFVSAATDGLTVRTQQGVVQGSLVNSTVRQFLGIPYAVAQRWQAPTLPPLRPQVFNASSFGLSCIQNLNVGNVEFLRLAGARDQDIFISEGENCQSINIWAPSINRKQSTAVLVWIYGGGFDFGTSNLLTYVGANMVLDNDDITLVTFNYRLNIFGQPNAPQLNVKGKAQNFGLLDVDAAIQWVHANIANFGGDPNRISIFGQSAGSVAVDAYTFAHPNDTIVKGIIEQSGSISGGGFGANPLPINATPWNTVSQIVGCGSTANAAQLACMQKVDARKLENAVNASLPAMPFGLVIDNVTVFGDTSARAQAGNFLKVPMLTGSTANEDDIFVVAAELVANGFDIQPTTDIIADIGTLSIFTCPASVAASLRVKANVPTFRYQYQAIFPNLSPRPDLRAWHASEIPIVFGTYNNSLIPATPTEIALSTYVQSAWVKFAQDPKMGLLNFGWQAYNPTTASLALLGNFNNATGVIFVPPALIDAPCANLTTFLSIAAQLSS